MSVPGAGRSVTTLFSGAPRKLFLDLGREIEFHDRLLVIAYATGKRVASWCASPNRAGIYVRAVSERGSMRVIFLGACLLTGAY
jgi:hypothetical protein